MSLNKVSWYKYVYAYPMELFTTVVLIALSFIFSIFLITKGTRGMKKSIKELKDGNN